MAVGATGLTAACLTYGVFHWLGVETNEKTAHRVFAVLGAILAICICVLTSGLIARMVTTQLIEGRKAGAGELRQFARDRWSALLGIPLGFGGIALLALGVEALLSLVGSIPGIGPIVFAASFVPAFLLSLTAVLTASVHMIGAFLYPTIVAIRGVGAMGAILEVVELARRKPLYILIYEMVMTVVGAIMTFIIGMAVWASLNLTIWLAGSIMQEKFEQTLSALPGFFRIFVRPFSKVLPLAAEEAEVAWHYDASGALLGFSLLIVVVLTLVYPFVFFTSAGSITYLILRTEPERAERSPIEDL